MNGWLKAPLIIMLCVLIGSVIFGTSSLSNAHSSTTISNQNITINGATGQVGTSTTTSNTFDLSTTDLILGILGVAIAAGIAAGIQVLGSGGSVLTQELIIKSIMYVGFWGALTVVTSSMFFMVPIFGGLIYLALTVCYAIGFISDLRTGSGA